MTQKIMTISSSRVDLPKSWKGSKIMVQFPNEDTLVAKRLSSTSEQKTDFAIDKNIWNKIEPAARNARKRVFQEFYPSLHALAQKSSGKTK